MESRFVVLRLEAGLTQKQIAQELGVSEQTVRNWEQGKHPPRLTIPQTKRLCVLLDRPIEEIPDDFGADDSVKAIAAERPGTYN
ncbi:MAG: helix-turn-helix transcriptional regulator [Leptolyngbyaceae cyanobacterium]